jgi:murein DD-endopeptidase MepM/ murein hydrolase activator NlpD
MQKPILNYNHTLPSKKETGSFAFKRKFDIHTGVDLYCEDGEKVFAIEDGKIVNIEKFTGEWAGSPWWENTEAILIEGASGVICYGEVLVDESIRREKEVKEGDFLGVIKRVLKKDKGLNPSSMLHFELYKAGTTGTVIWDLDQEYPDSLLDPTPLLKKIFIDNDSAV